MGHDGEPIRLKHVLGLATPWLSTKEDESGALGQFGIGISSLRSLSTTFEVHCNPYHVQFGEPTLAPVEPIELPATFGKGWTVFRVPLREDDVQAEDLAKWLEHWGDGGLLFLRHVTDVTMVTPLGDTVETLSIHREPAKVLHITDAPSNFSLHRCRVSAKGGLSWTAYSTDVLSPTDVYRARKATDVTTPVGAAFPLHEVVGGQFYAGLPVVKTALPAFVNAQFDPETSRQNLGDTPWNRELLPLVAGVWGHAAVDLFRQSAKAAWRAMPVGQASDEEVLPSLVDRLNGAIIDAARSAVAQRVLVETERGLLGLGELAVECELLEGVLTFEEIAQLSGRPAALPESARDDDGRWRVVLDDWRTAGAGLPEPLGVERALGLLREEARSVRSTIALAAAGLRAGLGDELGGLPCVAANDGRRLIPPTGDAAEALAERVSPLAGELGIVTALHPDHLVESDDARLLLDWLRKRGALLDGTDDQVVVQRLAAAGRSGTSLADPLTDVQMDALRRAFESVDVDERTALGRDVGRAIKLRAHEYTGRGRKSLRTVSPAGAYLPKAIDRGRESFAVAAAKTSGIVWLDGGYRTILRSADGRAGIGAQKFLTLLGAETAPRPERHTELRPRFADPRLGLSRYVGESSGRQAAMADLGATYTLADWDCPVIVQVVHEIARMRQGPRRRTRSRALLATLARAWPRLSDYSEVTAAHDHYTWQEKGRTAAFWLWQVRDVAWLDDEGGTPRRPSELHVRTPGTEAIFGADSSDFLHQDLLGVQSERRNWQTTMAALGVSGDPTRRELVTRLRRLRDDASSAEMPTHRAAIVYRALADSLESGARSDMSPTALQRAFDEGDGLIATETGWRCRDEVLSGPPVFGEYRSFVPRVPGTDSLWQVLDLQGPSLQDCIDVLRQIARKRHAPTGQDEAVQLDTLRLMAEWDLASASSADRANLRKLPRWTTQGWVRNGPVIGVDAEWLVGALGDSVPVWRPGGDLEQFRSLLGPLGIEAIGSAEITVANSEEAVQEPDVTRDFRAAVGQLRDDLVRNEPVVTERLQGHWDDLGKCSVWSNPQLKVAVRLPASAGGRTLLSSAHVKVDTDRQTVFVRDPQVDLPRADRGGQAIAALFDGERRRVALAWQAAWDRAKDGQLAHEIELARQRALREQNETSAEIDRQLAELQDGKRGKSSPPTGGLKRKPSASGSKPSTGQEGGAGTEQRKLVDPDALTPVHPLGQLSDEPLRRNAPPARPRSGELVDPRRTSPGGGSSRTPLRGYSDQDRETVGLELARKVLSSDRSDIVDLRAQRGVGADAMDELGRFFELKVFAGAEPNEVSLTSAEWERAKRSADFFLVVVSHVEASSSRPSVRIIPKPLDQLNERTTGTVVLSGVQGAKSLTYEFAEEDEPD